MTDAPPPAADEAKILVERMIGRDVPWLRSLFRPFGKPTMLSHDTASNEIANDLEKAAALLSRIHSEEATTMEAWPTLSEWWQACHKRGFVTGSDVDELRADLALAGFRITRAPGAVT